MAENTLLDYIDNRLIHWAMWSRRGNRVGKGYPTKSIEWRILHEGFIVSSFGLEHLESDAAAEEIESLLQSMHKIDSRMAEVIRINYLDPELAEQKAKRLHLGYTRYRAYLYMGLQWLSGRLSERYKLS